MESQVSSLVATSPGPVAHLGGSEDDVGSSTPSYFRSGRRQHDESRTGCPGLRASPRYGVVEASRAELMLFLADREQSSVVHSCLDDVHLCKRPRVHHLTRKCILDMSLNRALSSHTPVAG
jgi:hypothetical protein